MAFQFAGLRKHDPDGFGGFQLLARLGEGGMGQVFLALSPGGVPAAVKVIRSEFTQEPQFAERFAQEIAAAQRVRGAHIAALLDADARAAQPWLATSYVAGPSLRDLVLGTSGLPERQVLLLAGGIAHALTDIHTARVVHRDLKPANIVLDETGPKVIDFGIVKSLTQSATYTSQSTRIGTPLYMSPEQAMGRAVGAASDVFALGSTLYFLATGQEAFGAENEWAVAHRIVADAPDLSAVPEPLRRLLTDCLNKDPDRRPTPSQVRERCDVLLGNGAGSSSWMSIDGAREAIRERTNALRALTVRSQEVGSTPTRPEAPPGSGNGNKQKRSATAPDGPPEQPSRPAQPDKPSPRPSTDRFPTTLGRSLLFMALAALVSATQRPMLEETFTLASAGQKAVRVVLAFDWQHPLGAANGSPDSSDWLLAPITIIGTAVAILLAAIGLPRAGRKPGNLATWASVVSMLLAAGFLLLGVAVLKDHTADSAYTAVDRHLLSGGWRCIIANTLILATGGLIVWWDEIRPTWKPK
ncbi:serine/threonine protein kinase [Streptomyces litmocidini]|uniref:serine/threonine protein kinase n=1 Tax=Streptomyces litmocidini TaxID=67318 RepID=UPI00167D5BA3|nr:serine/threonine-protein kinase [Streptomyces litmocidini]